MISRSILQAALERDLLVPVDRSCISTTEGAHTGSYLFEVEYQLHAINRKASGTSVPAWQRTKAFEQFLELQEALCVFNDGFRRRKRCSKLERARDIIAGVLPPVESIWDEMWELCTFGPGTFHGAVKELRRVGYSLHYKIGGDQTVTPKAKWLAIKVLQEFYPNWADHLSSSMVCLATVPGNRLAHVPKDVEKCRPIAIEPSLNVFLQQGVGRWLGRHMKRIGFADIYDGQEVQRRLAGDRNNATIDLSNASDTISLELCKFLLPADWFEVLDACRSHYWSFGQSAGRYENISSQGNAFTFPLETMIFKAIVMAFSGLGSRSVSVYGDDIIVPLSAANAALAGLLASGFIPNEEKSYYGQHNDIRAHFRESCGADYLYDREITPIYYREDAKHYRDVATLYNKLYERWGFLPSTHNYLLSLIPAKERLFGPQDFISDGKDLEWLEPERYVTIPLGYNRVVRSYSSWIWSNPFHDMEFSRKAWQSKGGKIGKDYVLNERTSYLTFLLGDDGNLPRTSFIVKRKQDVVAVQGVPQGLLKALRFRRNRSF